MFPLGAFPYGRTQRREGSARSQLAQADGTAKRTRRARQSSSPQAGVERGRAICEHKARPANSRAHGLVERSALALGRRRALE